MSNNTRYYMLDLTGAVFVAGVFLLIILTLGTPDLLDAIIARVMP